MHRRVNDRPKLLKEQHDVNLFPHVKKEGKKRKFTHKNGTKSIDFIDQLVYSKITTTKIFLEGYMTKALTNYDKIKISTAHVFLQYNQDSR